MAQEIVSQNNSLSTALKRALDFAAALSGLVVLVLPLLGVAIAVRATSKGPAIHWSHRFGRHNKLFWMPKFRTMRTDTPDVATHLLQDPQAWLTPIGWFLRKSNIDELPQLYSVLTGDMSLVGPRPALHTQHDLIEQRSAHGVEALRPGITGWAQVNGRDEIPQDLKVMYDAEYLRRQSLAMDIGILWRTVSQGFGGKGVSH